MGNEKRMKNGGIGGGRIGRRRGEEDKIDQMGVRRRGR